jgi:hypothetical protein
MPFSLKILECDMHSLLDVIKGFHCFKDCEDNSPIITANPRDELKVFRKLGISPQVRYWRVSSVQFPYKYTLHGNSYFSSSPMHIIHSYHHKILYIICTATINLFQYSPWLVGNQCLSPDDINFRLNPYLLLLRVTCLATLRLIALSEH